MSDGQDVKPRVDFGDRKIEDYNPAREPIKVSSFHLPDVLVSRWLKSGYRSVDIPSCQAAYSGKSVHSIGRRLVRSNCRVKRDSHDGSFS